MDQLRALRYFATVAEAGSFSGAAKQFDVPASSVSRRVSDLEAYLGAQLIHRTTRTVQLTEVGLQYLTQIKPLLSALKQSDDAVRAYQTEPQGILKISSMVGFGERVLIPLLDEFNQTYENIRLDVELSDAVTRVDKDDVDIAIRGGFAPDQRVVAIKLMDNEFIPAASSAYLAEHGVPQSTRQLSRHRGLFFKTPAGPTHWYTELDGQWQDVSGDKILVSNNGRWLIRQAEAGKGIVMLPHWVLAESFARGTLVPLKFPEPLSITQNQPMGVYLIYQKLRYHIPKVKALVDFLSARLRQV